MRPPAEEPISRPQSSIGRDISIIPRESIGGRALTIIIAIMTFLVCLTGGGATLIAEASRNWRDLASKEITIQVKPHLDENINSLVQKVAEVAERVPSVAFVHVLSQIESERTLEPWLGEGLDLSQLPVPRLIVLTIDDSHPPDLRILRETLTSAAPQGILDDHQLWASRLDALADTAAIISAGILLLIITAMSIAIAFATRGAVSSNHEIIAVLHFVGAADSYIAKQFHTHFTLLGAQGAALGGSAAACFFMLPTLLSFVAPRLSSSNRLTATFSDFTLSVFGYFFIIVICLMTAVLTGIISRIVVLRHLERVS